MMTTFREKRRHLTFQEEWGFDCINSPLPKTMMFYRRVGVQEYLSGQAVC